MPLTGTTADDVFRLAQRRRRWVWALVILVILGVSAGIFVYRPWRLKSLHMASREALQKGDYMSASIHARRALQISPNFVPACVTMAEIAEHNRAPDAITWREQVLRLQGESADTLLGLASTALSFGKISSARSALDRVPVDSREREEFLVLSGAIAMEARDYVQSARLYEAAIRLNPGKAGYQFALGRAKVESNDALTREEGRRLLLDLTSHETVGAPALRSLIANFEAQKEYLAALRHARQLLSLPSHRFSDELLCLRLMRKTGDEKFASVLLETQQKVESDARQVSALLLWMSADGLAKEGIEWVQIRKPRLAQLPEIRPAMAGCYLMMNDWGALLAITQKGQWDSVEYVRRAYRARAFREHEQAERLLARTEWELALNAAGGQIDALTWLAQMASEWEWIDEQIQTLWAILERVPGSTRHAEALRDVYLERNDTAGLRRLAHHLSKADPADENARNDFALASLLLNIETDRAMAMARELYVKHPENPAFNSTYAFALHSAGRTVEGLEVLETLPPERLKEPTIAAYYGIMLASNFAPEKAAYFLEIGRRGILLPEEKKLIAKAEQKIRASSQ